MTDRFWDGRRVLVTGHTGFKGAWLTLWLQRLGAYVTGFALPPDDDRGAFAAFHGGDGVNSRIGDLRQPEAVAQAIAASDPEVIFHLAAQALVGHGYSNPFETYHTNVVGTANLLHELGSATNLRAVVVVTSDKVYANEGPAVAFTEGDPLGGTDPYSASKALADLLVTAWRRSGARHRAVAISTARAGNVIGGGDRGAERLLPDAWRALEAGEPLRLRYPTATRPWQFVLEPLHGYLLLAERLATDPSSVPEAVNFAPGAEASRPVQEVVERLFELWGMGRWEPVGHESLPEATSLQLNSDLARRTLGWTPRLGLGQALEWTTNWWRADARGDDLRQLASSQIAAYENLGAV